MLDSKTILAPAKLNIFLKVLNKRIDGYHSLRTGITFIDLFDKIEIKKSDETKIKYKGFFKPKYNNYNDALLRLSSYGSPLASYIFSNKSSQINQFIESTKSGAVCINDLSIHLIHDKLPFGGVGKSGIGCYHGKFGFDELSNSRPVIKNISQSPLKLMYPPYTKKVQKMLKWLKKLI